MVKVKSSRNKFLAMFSVVFCMAALFCGSINAYNLYNNQSRMIGGVSGRDYYLESSATTYSSIISEAMDAWIYANWSNPILFYDRGLSSNTSITFKGYSTIPNAPSANAMVKHYSASGIYMPQPSANWKYCDVLISQTKFSQITSREKLITIVHELGHCFGLQHETSNRGVIMYYDINTIQTSTPQYDDIDGINYLY